MTDTTDWKLKYRDSLLEMELDEKRWREVERLLRRLVGRLCAAGLGQNAQLDDELTALAAANRRNADAVELARLAETLTTAVVAVDEISSQSQRLRTPAPQFSPTPQLSAPPQLLPAPAAAPPPPLSTALPFSPTPLLSTAPAAVRWDATCAAVATLLERLQSAARDTSAVQALTAELANAATDAALAAVVTRAADLIHQRSEALARERLQAAAVLSEVTKRLEEMSRYMTEANSASRTQYDDTQTLNDTVMSHVRELTDEVSSATELGLLQSTVSARLESVARQVCEFRAREQNRQTEFNGRAEHMRTRIADLERETLDLHSKLDMEKHGARLDPLTGVANRKSFDERFAQEVARRAQGGPPAVMLMWDIDSFKAINDSYGHRAGDRVLQSVAGCFAAALRAADFVARIGGEEFAVLLIGLGLADAVNVANQLRTAVESLRFHFRGTPVRVTVSCGVTELKVGDALDAAFDRADAALYRAKDGGKNLCVAA